MGIGSRFRRALRRGNWIDSVKVEELEQELLKLENQLNLLAKEIKKLEETKKKLFQEGIGKSDIEKILLAEKIKDIDAEVKMKLKEYNKLRKQRRAVANLIRLKKWEARLKETGIWEKISKMEPEKLIEALSRTQLEDRNFEQNIDKINEILGQAAAEVEIDEGTKEIFELWDKIERAELTPEAVEEELSIKLESSKEKEEETL